MSFAISAILIERTGREHYVRLTDKEPWPRPVLYLGKMFLPSMKEASIGGYTVCHEVDLSKVKRENPQ